MDQIGRWADRFLTNERSLARSLIFRFPQTQPIQRVESDGGRVRKEEETEQKLPEETSKPRQPQRNQILTLKLNNRNE